MRVLLLWLINAVTLLLIPYITPSVSVNSLYTALITALILGLVNSVIRPILLLLTLPITIVTLGLFILVINGLMFWFVASFVDGFHVAGFWSAFWGAILYGILSTIFTAIVMPRHHPQPPVRSG